MSGASRRARILAILQAESPVTGANLAARLGVTRQVVVQDVTILRAQGQKIIATPRGYTLLSDAVATGVTRLVPVRHSKEDTKDELYTMVDLGVEVLDVIVDHPVYGQLTGQLSLSSRRDVDDFMNTIAETKAGLLSSLTDGIHLHTVRARDEGALACMEKELKRKGFLLPE